MSRFQYLNILLTLIAFSVMLACGSVTDDKKIVTVSIEPQKYLLEQIAGGNIQVRCLLSDGANPETYDPSMTHMLNLQKSAAYMRMGNIGFEAALIDKIHDSNPDLPVYNTSVGIVPVTGTHQHGPGGDETAVDPHTWTSVKNARVIARNMLEALIEIDPANADSYRENHRRFDSRLETLDSTFTAMLAPVRGKSFLVWHPSLSYLARDYGLNQVVVGGHESKETSVNGLRHAVEEAREHGAEIFFSQTDVDSRHVSALNAEIGAQEVSINPLSAKWEDEMIKIVQALAPQS
ncbi:MAG: zinc ABC transporter substrate-binding protein [Muribaculaceae bacterium]|nr:zinc ABC transporter substrate-binding protein [Muribaculaceae bacterium]